VPPGGGELTTTSSTAPGPSPALADKLRLLPDRPGVYLFRDAAGGILYVGKAVSLRNRVRSYFQSGKGLEGKTLAMLALAADLEFIVTDSEVEALILENDLIKRHRPKYNIRLRDDKQYPYLRLDLGAPWPRLELVRRPAADGARYFGPYPHASAVWETMQTLRRVFPYRSCSDRRLQQPHPCLYYHIHRCAGPCIGAVTPEQYGRMVAEMAEFLQGKGEEVLGRLEARMHAAAEELRFEEAAELRDRLAALRSVLEKQKVQLAIGAERDVLAVAMAGPEAGEAAVQAFFFREGKLAGRDGFVLTGAEGRSPGEVLQAFIDQFYGGGAPVPAEVFVSDPLPDAAETRALLRQRRQGPVRLHCPRRGQAKELVELVRRNAQEFLAAERWRREKSREALEAALAELQQALALPKPPRRIECFDNSNLHGAHPVSAMVVFEDGQPRKAEYRKFRVKTVDGPDDFATMREVLRRRFARALRERAELAAQDPEGQVPDVPGGFARLPDLVIIDGGRGQLSAARAAMRELGVEDIPAFGLAKEKEWLYAEDRREPIVLPRTSPALHLLQRIRDEAHRFGLGYHRQLRGRASVASLLEEVPGIGPKRRKALLQAFGSLEAIRAADVDRLAAVPGMTREAAEELVTYLRSGEAERSSMDQEASDH
jgi:excinuclease ABC subunit C